MRAVILALAAVALLLPEPLLAQAARPGGPGQRRPGGKAPKPEPEKQEIRLRAETQELVEKGHYRARGFVDLTAGELRIQSDEMDLYEGDLPGGGRSRRLVARGNVVFMREEERISGAELEMDLDSGVGTFRSALGYVQPGVFVEAETIERLDADTYRVQGAKFSACSQPTPRWSFSTSSGRIDVDDKVVARNVVFRVKSVPVLYLPYLLYPIREDQRSTGFLFPHVGYSSVRGVNVGEGFFWAMGRSADQTLYADYYSDYGYGLGQELRYVRDAPSRGNFRSYLFQRSSDKGWDYDLDWNAVQALPGKFRGALQVRQYSNLTFQQNFQDNVARATTRSRRSSGVLTRPLGSAAFQLLADSSETFFGDTSYRVNRRLPSARLQRFPRRLGRGPFVFGYELRGERLGLGAQDQVVDYARFDVAPELSAVLATSYLQVTPRVQVRYTRYGASLEDPDQPFSIAGAPIDRAFFEGSVEVAGPTFSRVFETKGLGYSDKIKHVIGPEFAYRYRTRVEDFELIPKFDMYDQYLGTDEVQYSLVQRLYAKRTVAGRGGVERKMPYEFLTWRVSQTYYVEIGDKQNEFDPNYSSSAFGPGGIPSHSSPIQSRLRLRPTPGIAANFDTEYDVNYNQFRRQSVSVTSNVPRLRMTAGWTRARRLAVLPENRVISANTLRGLADLDLVPNRLGLLLGADYDFVTDKFLHRRAQLRYEVQCCGFMVETIRYNYNQRVENQFRFSVELANIGSIGNFMGEQAEINNARGGGFR